MTSSISANTPVQPIRALAKSREDAADGGDADAATAASNAVAEDEEDVDADADTDAGADAADTDTDEDDETVTSVERPCAASSFLDRVPQWQRYSCVKF